MAKRAFEMKRDALRRGAEPYMIGSVVTEADDSIVMRAGGCIVEIPLDSIKSRQEIGDETRVILEEDAEILVGTLVSVKDGFLEDNVWGALVPGIFDDNCNCNCPDGNCNCNCNIVAQPVPFETVSSIPIFRSPFTGGARRAR